jgi:hypothetical protein
VHLGKLHSTPPHPVLSRPVQLNASWCTMGCTLNHKSKSFVVLMYRCDVEAFLNNGVAFNSDSLPTKSLDAPFDFPSNIQIRNRNNVERCSPVEYTYFPHTYLVISHTSLAFIFITRIVRDTYIFRIKANCIHIQSETSFPYDKLCKLNLYILSCTYFIYYICTIIIIIYLNFNGFLPGGIGTTIRQNTQITHITHKKSHYTQTKHNTQNYTNNKGHITYNEYNANTITTAIKYINFNNSVVGIATSYGLDDQGVGVRVPVGLRIFSSPNRPDRL